MAKHVKIVRTFPNSWYKFIVEGDATGLSDSERMIAESALAKAFPDGGDIIATRIGTKTQKYSTLVCESYSINGCPDKTEGKTFKVKVLADENKNPKTYGQYVKEDIKTLQNRRSNAPEYKDNKKKDTELSKGKQETSRKGTNAEDDISLVGRVAGYEPSRFDVTARVYDEWKQVFGTELNKDENAGETEDGSKTVTHEDAARLLQEEIVKACESGDKERLKELRPLLPLLAWYSSKYNRYFTTMFKSMTTQGDQLKVSAYHKMVEVLPAIYDVAFGLDASEEDVERAKKFVGDVEILRDAYKQGEMTPEERKEYAEKVFENAIYGRVPSEKVAGEVTQNLASTQQSNFSRMERSEFNTYFKPFIKWYGDNKDSFDMAGYIDGNWTKMDPYEFNYARGVYYIDSIRDMVTDIEEDVNNLSDDTKMTQEGIERAYERLIAFSNGNNGGEKFDSRKKKCFQGLVQETWSKLGLTSSDAKNGKGKGKRTKVVLGDFPGSVGEFKKEFHAVCEETKTKLESMLVSLNNEYDAFKDEHEETMKKMVSDLESGKSIKDNRSRLPEFSLKDDSKVLGAGTASREWIDKFATSRTTEMVFNVSMDKFRNRQMNDQGQHVIEIGMTDQQQNRVTGGGDDFDDARGKVGGGDMDSTEDQKEQDAIGGGDSAGDDMEATGGSVGPVSYDEDKDDAEVNFPKLNEELIGEDEEEIKSRAKDLNLNPERAVKIVDDWKKICEAPGGIGEVMGIAQTKGGKSKETKDEDSQKYLEAAELFIKSDEEKREADYKDAKAAFDDAVDGGDKNEIKAAKEELDRAKKNRKLSSKEKAEIMRKVRYNHVGKGIDVQKSWESLVGKKGALSQGAWKLGGAAVLELVRKFGYMFAPQGTEEDTYKGLPDLLVLLMHDEIMKCHEKNSEESLETCIDRVSRAARPEFITFTADISQLHKYVTDRISNESAGDDKFLASIEQMLDLIENSDLDAQAKLDMLDALELSFAMWCEKNDVVPEKVNPEEDADAVNNHPEDAE